MRAIVAGLFLGGALVVSGCDHWSIINKQKTPPSTVLPPAKTPEAADLVKYLNDNADRIGGLTAAVDVDAKQDRQSVGLDGNLACSRNRNFRLKGRVLGNPAVDIGSNDNEFWWWISKNDPPYVFHCSYADLARGVKPPFPFHPDMVLAALGMAKYDPAKPYRVEARGKYIELIEETTTPQGQPAERVTVFDAYERKAPDPQVLGHVLRDKQRQVICQATVQKVAVSGQTGAVVPQRLVLAWPTYKMQMNMTLSKIEVVNFPAEAVARFFQRDQLSRQYTSFDWGRQAVDSPGVQRAGLR